MRVALSEIGFSNVEAQLFAQVWHVDSAAQILEAICGGTVRAQALLTAQSDAAIKGVCRFIEEAISDMANDAGGFEMPLPAVLGSGAKSAGNLARLRAHIDRGPSGVY
jgi:hypothetical protein